MRLALVSGSLAWPRGTACIFTPVQGQYLAETYRVVGRVQADHRTSSPYWLAMSHGAVSQSIPIATAYDTLGEEGVKHSLIQTQAKAIYCDPQLLPTLINPLKEAKEVKYVIYNSEGEFKQENIDKLKAAVDHLTVLSFDELHQLGKDNPIEPTPPGPEDLCCIMYTSGTTGPPKGVPIKHKAVLASSKLYHTIYRPLDDTNLA